MKTLTHHRADIFKMFMLRTFPMFMTIPSYSLTKLKARCRVRRTSRFFIILPPAYLFSFSFFLPKAALG
jgi:hypothetical protein